MINASPTSKTNKNAIPFNDNPSTCSEYSSNEGNTNKRFRISREGKHRAYESAAGLRHPEDVRMKARKNVVSFLRPEIFGFHEESALLLGQYPNCFRTCSQGLMSVSLTLFSLSSSRFRASPALAVLPVPPAALSHPSHPRGREIVGPIEFSTVLDDDAESSLAFPPSRLRGENRPWRKLSDF